MATPSPSPAQFLSSLLTAVHDVTGRRPPPTWTHVDKVQAKLGTANRDALDAAIRVAVATGMAARRWRPALIDHDDGRRHQADRARRGGGQAEVALARIRRDNARMTARTRRTLLKTAAATVAAPLVLPAVGRAQGSWPSKPIRCIVPLPPGGGTDTIGRRAMQRLSEALGVPVVVENRAGAGGTIGSDVVAKAEPDGYTIGIATASSHSAAPVFRKDLPYDPVKSFTAITMLGTTPYILIGGPAAGATDLAGFIAAAKAKPGKVNCASVGVSTLGYLLTKQFELLAGIEMVDVPYKGSALAYPDLMSGTVAVMLDNPSGSAGLVREGRLTGFAVTRPSPVLPNVPTFESLGVKGFDAVFWYGVVGPAGLPPAIADRIQKALAEGFLTDQGRASLRAMDVEPVMSTPAVFAAAMAKQTQDLRALADRLGIKPTE